MKIKIFLKELSIFFLNYIVNKIPFYNLRYFFYKIYFQSIGNNVFISLGVKVLNPSNILIGDNSVIGQDCILDGRSSKIIIGKNVDIAIQTNIWTLDHDPNSNSHENRSGEVIIEDYAWIASRVTILPNVKISFGTVVGSNSLVTKNTGKKDVVVGNPAKKISTRESDLNYNLNYYPRFK